MHELEKSTNHQMHPFTGNFHLMFLIPKLYLNNRLITERFFEMILPAHLHRINYVCHSIVGIFSSLNRSQHDVNRHFFNEQILFSGIWFSKRKITS